MCVRLLERRCAAVCGQTVRARRRALRGCRGRLAAQRRAPRDAPPRKLRHRAVFKQHVQRAVTLVRDSYVYLREAMIVCHIISTYDDALARCDVRESYV